MSELDAVERGHAYVLEIVILGDAAPTPGEPRPARCCSGPNVHSCDRGPPGGHATPAQSLRCRRKRVTQISQISNPDAVASSMVR
jgi:hypothetical protein